MSAYQALCQAAERAENLLRLQQIEEIVAQHPDWIKQDDRLQNLIKLPQVKRTA